MMAAKRLSYSNGFKLKVAELAIKNGNRSAGREYGVSEKLVRDWRKKKTELAKLPRAGRSQRPGVRPRWPELKNRLLEWVLERRMNGIGISRTMIRLKAKSMAKNMPPGDVEGFTGSTCWLYETKESCVEAENEDSTATTTRI